MKKRFLSLHAKNKNRISAIARIILPLVDIDSIYVYNVGDSA